MSALRTTTVALLWLTCSAAGPSGAPAGASTASADTPAADGAALYQSLCASCHGASGRGDGPGMPEGAIRPRPFALDAFKFDPDADWETGTDADLAAVIRDGAARYGGSPIMPPWPQLSTAQVAALVAHIRRLQHREPHQ